jgi:hypothetical protein
MPLSQNNPSVRRKIFPRLIFFGLIIIISAAAVFFGVKYFTLKADYSRLEIALAAQKKSDAVLDFTQMFIEKVLQTQSEVDFDTRMKLENAVINLNDEQILDQWKKFTGSKTNEEAQQNVKDLLETLIIKIKS